MHLKRYMAFYHCNTAAFVASVVVIIIVQSKVLSTVWGAMLLKTAMILDLFGLMGAYVAGSCRDPTTTIFVAALAVAVFLYTMAKVVAVVHLGGESFRQRGEEATQGAAQVPPLGSERILEEKKLERKRKFLLQLAILAATVTYQTGLNPPGGFWTESNGDKLVTAGDPILLDYYGVRYQVFFYCNAAGFMASVTVILLLVNQTLSKPGIRTKALYVCVMVGLLGLMGAYAAGSCRKLRTSIYVFALVAAVVAFLILEILLHWLGRRGWSKCLPKCLTRLFETLSTGPGGGSKNKSDQEVITTVDKLESEDYEKRKYLMVLGILAASVTYQAGLAPPGGTWGDDDTASSSPLPSPSAHPPTVAGNPILLDFNAARYQAFFYCNATSFVASVVVILMLLQRTTKKQQPGAPLRALQTAVVLDLLGLLGAYAAGSCRDWETSSYVIALVAAVVVFTLIYVLLSFNVVRAKAEE
uniref:PGG domain-containing protein n=1 Tax=Triticum urartu TaxID=4572 RepID=A0A8R7UQD9_TRIUA